METTSMDADEPGRSVAAGQGLVWWTDAWGLMMKNIGLWLVLGLIVLIITMVCSVLPAIGSLAACVVMPVLTGGWMLAAHKVRAGGKLDVADLFLCFQDQEKLKPLLILGGLCAAAMLVIGAIGFTLGLGAVLSVGAAMATSTPGAALGGLVTGLFALLVCLLALVPVSMAMWFAPQLVVFRNTAPVDALKMSFAASLSNIPASLLFGVLLILWAVVLPITLGLAVFVFVPLLMLTLYTSYQDIFGV